MRWAGCSTLSITGADTSLRTVGTSETEAAMVAAFVSAPHVPGDDAGTGFPIPWPDCPHSSEAGSVASPITGCACWGEGVAASRRLPQFKQKLSPGRVSALQKGHLSMMIVPPFDGVYNICMYKRKNETNCCHYTRSYT